MFSKYAILSPNSLHFHDKRTFVPKYCRPDMRTFSANFSVSKSRSPPICSFLECMNTIQLLYIQIQNHGMPFPPVESGSAKTVLANPKNTNTILAYFEIDLCKELMEICGQGWPSWSDCLINLSSPVEFRLKHNRRWKTVPGKSVQ